MRFVSLVGCWNSIARARSASMDEKERPLWLGRNPILNGIRRVHFHFRHGILRILLDQRHCGRNHLQSGGHELSSRGSPLSFTRIKVFSRSMLAVAQVSGIGGRVQCVLELERLFGERYFHLTGARLRLPARRFILGGLLDAAGSRCLFLGRGLWCLGLPVVPFYPFFGEGSLLR